jgi:hypothetical protein
MECYVCEEERNDLSLTWVDQEDDWVNVCGPCRESNDL